jgi:hypothetical protein
VYWQAPVLLLQPFWVQGLLSSHTTGAPTHWDCALHVSLVVQAFPSLQFVPGSAELVQAPLLGLQESAVQGFASPQFLAAPGTQLPPLH